MSEHLLKRGKGTQTKKIETFQYQPLFLESSANQKMNKFIPFLLFLLLAACDSRIDGKHSDGGAVTYDFKSDGKVSVTILGDTAEMAYDQQDADHVKVNGPKGSLSFTRQTDGTWLGPLDVKLTKVGR
jgi:hypothetical protein